jgi:crotonobetainyl-CoA:carnitine CoA-transferase CaiB-like acyl-CoA transferase
MIAFRPEAACPLDGIVMLDRSRLVAGNMLPLQLADFGAEVVKIGFPRRQGSRSNITSPRNVYRTPGDLSISGSMQSMVEGLYAAVGVPDMTKDARFAQHQRAPCQQRGGQAADPRVRCSARLRG